MVGKVGFSVAFRRRQNFCYGCVREKWNARKRCVWGKDGMRERARGGEGVARGRVVRREALSVRDVRDLRMCGGVKKMERGIEDRIEGGMESGGGGGILEAWQSGSGTVVSIHECGSWGGAGSVVWLFCGWLPLELQGVVETCVEAAPASCGGKNGGRD